MKHLLSNKFFQLFLFGAFCFSSIQMTNAQSWSSLAGPQIASSVKDISITTDGSTLFIADANYVLKSTNSGTAWKPSGVTYSSPLLVLVKPDDAAEVVVAKNGELRYNSDGGDAGTWSLVINNANLVPLRLAAAVNDASKMLLGKQYHSQSIYPIYRSENGGADWDPVTGFTEQTHIYDFCAYPNSTDEWAVGIVWAGGTAPNGTPGEQTILRWQAPMACGCQLTMAQRGVLIG